MHGQTDMPQSIAARVPVELFDLILSFYTAQDLNDAQLERNYVKTEKRQISSVALVCRTWAAACQPKLFEELELRCREDLRQLLVLMAHSQTKIQKYIWSIKCRVKVSDPSPPWIYLAYVQLIPKITSSRQSRTVDIYIDGPFSHEGYKGLKQQLFLRPLPPSVTRVSNFYLADLHFKRFRDLVKLVSAFPSLKYVKCDRVTWDSVTDNELPPPKSSLSRCTPYNRQYSMHQCTDIGAAAWLPLLLSQDRIQSLRPQEAHSMRRIASALTQGSSLEPHPALAVSSYTSKGSDMHFYVLDNQTKRYMRPYTTLYFSPRLEDGSHSIQMIVLDFNPYRNALPIAELVDCVDWTMLDEQLALLQNLGTILLVFESPKDLQSIDDQIMQQKLPRLCCSPKLKYVISNEKDHPERRWLRCTPSTVDQDIVNGLWLSSWRDIV